MQRYRQGGSALILAVMQPYLFPYLGYYQLAHSAQHFVFLDDVAFIKKGFINRNRILLDGKPFNFTLPIADISQNRPINAHHFTGDFDAFLKQIRHAYTRAPFFRSVFEMIESVCLASQLNVAEKNTLSVCAVFDYLKLPFICSSASSFPAGDARGQQRILDLCRHFAADAYHNAAGGRELYEPKAFADCAVQLRFLQNHFPSYAQCGGGPFVPGWSIIDVLMNNEPEQARLMLQSYELVEAA